MVATLTKLLGKILAVIIASLLLCYLLLLLINIKDEPPSAAAQTMQQLQQAAASAAEQSTQTNGYAYLAQHGSLPNFRLAEPLAALMRQCNQGDCQQLLGAEPELARWVNEHDELAAFYQQIRSFDHWYETVPTDAAEALPSWQPLLEGQQLLFAQAWLALQQQDIAQARQLLQQDMQFWRGLLTKHNLLIGKMVSSAAIKRHFEFAAMLQQELVGTARAALTPDSWQMAFTAQELNLRQVLSGEWVYGNAIIEQTLLSDDPIAKPNMAEKLAWWLLKPLYQPQATSNQRAAMLLAQADNTLTADTPWYSWVYNPVGKMLNIAGAASYLPYRQRLEQLEPLRLQLLTEAK